MNGFRKMNEVNWRKEFISINVAKWVIAGAMSSSFRQFNLNGFIKKNVIEWINCGNDWKEWKGSNQSNSMHSLTLHQSTKLKINYWLSAANARNERKINFNWDMAASEVNLIERKEWNDWSESKLWAAAAATRISFHSFIIIQSFHSCGKQFTSFLN